MARTIRIKVVIDKIWIIRDDVQRSPQMVHHSAEVGMASSSTNGSSGRNRVGMLQ